jgi:hypothetical protein
MVGWIRGRKLASVTSDQRLPADSPLPDEGLGGDPLLPNERGRYRTAVATDEVLNRGNPLRPESRLSTDGTPIWIVVGLGLLVLFFVILAYAVVAAALA